VKVGGIIKDRRNRESEEKENKCERKKIRRKGGNEQINYNHNYIWTPSRLV
jgi:hypothetical protein